MHPHLLDGSDGKPHYFPRQPHPTLPPLQFPTYPPSSSVNNSAFASRFVDDLVHPHSSSSTPTSTSINLHQFPPPSGAPADYWAPVYESAESYPQYNQLANPNHPSWSTAHPSTSNNASGGARPESSYGVPSFQHPAYPQPSHSTTLTANRGNVGNGSGFNEYPSYLNSFHPSYDTPSQSGWNTRTPSVSGGVKMGRDELSNGLHPQDHGGDYPSAGSNQQQQHQPQQHHQQAGSPVLPSQLPPPHRSTHFHAPNYPSSQFPFNDPYVYPSYAPGGPSLPSMNYSQPAYNSQAGFYHPSQPQLQLPPPSSLAGGSNGGGADIARFAPFGFEHGEWQGVHPVGKKEKPAWPSAFRHAIGEPQREIVSAIAPVADKRKVKKEKKEKVPKEPKEPKPPKVSKEKKEKVVVARVEPMDAHIPTKSHLNPPRKPLSAWQIYFNEVLAAKKEIMKPGERFNVADIAKEAGKIYKELDEEGKSSYLARAKEAKNEHLVALAAYTATLTPSDIRQENLFRAHQRKAGKSRAANLKDPNAPKPPLSPYFLFLRAIRANEDMTRDIFQGEKETTKQSIKAAEKWKTLDEEDKRPYAIAAEAEKRTFDIAQRQYLLETGGTIPPLPPPQVSKPKPKPKPKLTSQPSPANDFEPHPNPSPANGTSPPSLTFAPFTLSPQTDLLNPDSTSPSHASFDDTQFPSEYCHLDNSHAVAFDPFSEADDYRDEPNGFATWTAEEPDLKPHLVKRERQDGERTGSFAGEDVERKKLKREELVE